MEQQALGFTLQQGVAVAVCIAVALAFGFAIVKLFSLSRTERDTAAAAAAAERAQTREQFTAALDKYGAHVEALANKLQDNTHAIERLTDRSGARAA